VIIPHQNIKNLMLKDEVVQAVAEGKFHLYPIKTVDEGMEILTGIRAGERLADGSYEPETVNSLCDKGIWALGMAWQVFEDKSPWKETEGETGEREKNQKKDEEIIEGIY